MTEAGTYRVAFKRIGRNHDVEDIIAKVNDFDELAEHIYAYARPYLRSRDFEVTFEVCDGEGDGYIFCGMHSGGDFTITIEQPASGAGKLSSEVAK